MEILNLMQQDVYNKLCKDFKVDQETCESYERFYNADIEQQIRLRHLSHLVSSVEDKINDMYKEKYILPILKSDQYSQEQKRAYIRRNYRLYSILLRPMPGLHRKGLVSHFNYGSIISYNPCMEERDIRVIVAHEIGHIINVHVFRCDDTQNRANIFCFCAINGKDQFYKTETENLTYKSELEIIDNIFKLCPIIKHNQLA